MDSVYHGLNVVLLELGDRQLAPDELSLGWFWQGFLFALFQFGTVVLLNIGRGGSVKASFDRGVPYHTYNKLLILAPDSDS